MEMRTGLIQQQQQKLSLTQELTQAIALLQYNSQELVSFLEAKALENPLLEVKPSERLKGRSKSAVSSRKEKDINGIAVESSATLEEHLFSQIKPGQLSDCQKRIYHFLILNIDENGYFRGDINEIAEYFNMKPGEIEECLLGIQRLEPAGIGARSLQECLLLQLERHGEKAALARKIIAEHFSDFAEKKWKQLARDLKIKLQDIQEIHDFLQNLTPRPGTPFNQEKAAYLIPDVVVGCFNGKWEVQLLEGNLTRIDFNEQLYRSLTASGDKQTVKFLHEKYQDYQWLYRSIRQRNETLLRVAGKIVEKQKLFFENGKGKLKPLTMKEVADSLEIHESTVSRAVREKYIGTPFGTFELKSFFSTGIQTTDDSNASSAQAKSLISSYIEKEDKTQPISDQDIAVMLKENEGIVISRRTVAKYREQLGIASSSKRKRF